MKPLRLIPALLDLLTLGGCLGMPKNVSPVIGFELDRYLGKWYEIAWLDHAALSICAAASIFGRWKSRSRTG